MSEPYFPTPTAKSKDSAPYRSAALHAPPPSSLGAQIVHRPEANKPLIPVAALVKDEAPVVRAPGAGEIATDVAVGLGVRVLSLAIVVGIGYALIALFGDADSRVGVAVGILLCIAVPVGLVWILISRVRRLVRMIGRLFSSDSE